MPKSYSADLRIRFDLSVTARNFVTDEGESAALKEVKNATIGPDCAPRRVTEKPDLPEACFGELDEPEPRPDVEAGIIGQMHPVLAGTPGDIKFGGALGCGGADQAVGVGGNVQSSHRPNRCRIKRYRL